MVRRVLKDNKVPGTSAGTRVAKALPQGTGSATGFLGESQAGLCEQPGVCLDQGGLNRNNFSKRKRENRGTQRLVRELSPAAAASASGTSPRSAPGWRTLDKQPRRSPEPRLCVPRVADWGPTTETPADHPHLKPRVGAHRKQRLAAPRKGPKWQIS